MRINLASFQYPMYKFLKNFFQPHHQNGLSYYQFKMLFFSISTLHCSSAILSLVTVHQTRYHYASFYYAYHFQSVDVIVRALDDPSVRASRKLSLLQRAQRLSKHVKTGTSKKIRRLPDINYISAPVVCYLYVPMNSYFNNTW